MKPYKTQTERVKAKLLRDKSVSRNECLRQFPAITRLSAIIQTLENEGFVFEPRRIHGDYRYFLVSVPAPKQLPLLTSTNA